MSIKCKLGIHRWDGCICTECNKTRSTNHDLAEDCEKCAKCGLEIENNHDWRKNCEKCAKCGKTRENAHYWLNNCEKCSACGQVRENRHNITDGVCRICGHGIFVDDDEKVYKIIRIGENIMMAQNYAKEPESGNFWIYEEDKSNLAKYGFLYDFETALKMAPNGWHMPSKIEWENVCESLKGPSHYNCDNLKVGGHSGFEAVLAGWRSKRGHYIGEKASAHFWSSTQETDNKAWRFKLIANKPKAEFDECEEILGLSVRYFKDKET